VSLTHDPTQRTTNNFETAMQPTNTTNLFYHLGPSRRYSRTHGVGKSSGHGFQEHITLRLRCTLGFPRLIQNILFKYLLRFDSILWIYSMGSSSIQDSGCAGTRHRYPLALPAWKYLVPHQSLDLKHHSTKQNERTTPRICTCLRPSCRDALCTPHRRRCTVDGASAS
jgi:hypothetical protein